MDHSLCFVQLPKRLKQEIEKLDLSSKSSEEWLLAHPEDKLVSFILKQDKIRKNELRKLRKIKKGVYYG